MPELMTPDPGTGDLNAANIVPGGLSVDTFEFLTDRRPGLDASIFNSLTDAIVVADVDMAIERVNPAALKLTGFSEDDLLGRSIADLATNKRSIDKLFARLLLSDTLSGRFETYCVDKA